MSQNKPQKYTKKRRKQNPAWLPFLAIAGGILLIVLAFWGLRGNSSSKANIEVTGAPSLKADKEEVNLGDVKLDQTVQVSFRLTNVGDQALRFTEAPYIEVVEGC